MTVVARVAAVAALVMFALAAVLPLFGAGPAAAWAAIAGLASFVVVVASYVRQFPPPEQ